MIDRLVRLFMPGMFMQFGIFGAIAGGMVSAYMSNRAAGAQKDAALGAVGEQRRQFDLIREDTEPYREVGRNALYGMSNMLGLGNQQYHERQNRLNELKDKFADTKKFNTTGGHMVTRDVQQGFGRGAYTTQERSFIPEETTLNPEFTRLEDEIADLESQIEQSGGGPGEGGGFDVSQIPGYQFRFDQGTNALNRSLASSGNRFSGRAMKAAQRYGQGIASQEFGQHFNRLAGLAGTGQAAVGTSGQAGMQAAGNIGNAMMAGGRAQAQGAANLNNSIQGGIGNYMSYQQNQRLLNNLGNTGGGMPAYSGGGGYGYQAGR